MVDLNNVVNHGIEWDIRPDGILYLTKGTVTVWIKLFGLGDEVIRGTVELACLCLDHGLYEAA